MEIKKPKYLKSDKGISLSDNVDDSILNKPDYPIFCFRHLQKDYNIEKCTRSDKSFPKQFLKKIDLISKLSWVEIQFADKKGNGTEKILLNSIKPKIPSPFTKDVKFFLSFYFNGRKGRIIGHRNKSLFHIVYIDTQLKVYKH